MVGMTYKQSVTWFPRREIFMTEQVSCRIGYCAQPVVYIRATEWRAVRRHEENWPIAIKLGAQPLFVSRFIREEEAFE